MKQKEIFYTTVITAMVVSIVYYTIAWKPLETTNVHLSAIPTHPKKYSTFVCPVWTTEFQTQSNNWAALFEQNADIFHDLFVSQYESEMGQKSNNYWILAYKSPWRTKESYLNQMFIAAFWINELWCWSDSRQYGQKAAIIQFYQMLQKENNPKYQDIKDKTQELFMQAQYMPSNQRLPQYSNDFEMINTLEQLWWDMAAYTSFENYKRAKDLPQNDPRYNPNNCVPVPVTNVITKRPLSRMDGILAFQPELVNRVKWRWGYLPSDLWSHLDPAILVDNMLNLSLPIDNPYRWIVRWQQKWFHDFVKEQWLPANTSENPTLPLYQAYKAWLKSTWKAQPNKRQNWNASNTLPEQDNQPIPVSPIPLPWQNDTTDRQQPSWSVIITPLPPTRPQNPWIIDPSAWWVPIPDKDNSTITDQERRKMEEERLKEEKEKEQKIEIITSPLIIPNSVAPSNWWRILRF